jgi:protein-tyrosine phosphatase
MAPLPPPRNPGRAPYRIGLVCLGNICRSPIAAVVLRQRLAEAGLDNIVEVDSSGTGCWHAGEPMDRRASVVLAGAGYDGSAHRARQFAAHGFGDYDLLLAMDASNLRHLLAVAPDEESASRTRLFRDYDPRAGDDPDDRDVPDPFYGSDAGFAEVLRIVERTAEQLARRLHERLRSS